MTLSFDVLGHPQPVVLEDFDVVIAGYTGRDEESVRAHIQELAAIGVPPPASVPAFFSVDSALVTQSPRIVVDGANTSGEVEPVLVRAGGRLFLGVGSDHTDRDIERESVAASKAACAKPISKMLLPLPKPIDAFDWDSTIVRTLVDEQIYQEGALRTLRLPTDVLDLYLEAGGDDRADLVMFAGTVPVIGGVFVAGTNWWISLTVTDSTTISHAYSVSRGTE